MGPLKHLVEVDMQALEKEFSMAQRYWKDAQGDWEAAQKAWEHAQARYKELLAADYPSGTTAPAGKYPAKYQSTIDAYSDANKLSKADRDLDFLNKTWFTAKEWKECMELAVVNGYNEFDSTKVGKIIAPFTSLKFKTARESSVCMYVTGFKNKDELLKFLNTCKKMIADEVSVENEDFGYDVNNVIKKVQQWSVEVAGMSQQQVRVWWD
jgi:hypothetical protein